LDYVWEWKEKYGGAIRNIRIKSLYFGTCAGLETTRENEGKGKWEECGAKPRENH